MMYVDMDVVGLEPCAALGDSAEAGSSSSGGGGSHRRGSTLPQPVPVPLQLRMMRRVEQAVILFSLLLQLTLYSRSVTTLTLRQHMHQALLLALRAVCLIAATHLPTRVWLKYRVLLIGVLRISIASVPSQRTAREGDAVLLDRPASSGAKGALQDLLRLLSGTRLLPMALIGSMLLQPPLAVLAQQAVLMVLTSHNEGFCATQLLTHRLMRQRLAGLWRALEMWTPLVAPRAEPAWTQLSGKLRQTLQCVALLNWTQAVLGVVLPTLMAALTAPNALRDLGHPPHRRQLTDQRPGRVKAAIGWAQRVSGGAAASVGRLDVALQDCSRQGGLTRLSLLVVLGLLVANLWPLAKAWAARSLP